MGLHTRSWQLRQCVRIAGKGCDRCLEEKWGLVVRGSEARPVPRRKDELLLGKVCPNALCKLECIHSLEFQLNSNQSRMCQTLGCDGQLLKRKPRGKLPPPGPGILTRAPSSRAPHQDGTCNAGRILHLPTSFPACPSPPYRVWVPPRVCAFPSQQPLQASG